MAGTKRERELHRQKLARQQKEAAAAAAARGRWLRIGGVVIGVIAIIAVVVGVAASQGGSDGSPSASGDGFCTAPNGKSPSNEQYARAQGSVGSVKTYDLTMTTNCGQLKLRLDAANAPKTTQALAFLAGRGFYDNTTCHRLTTTGIYVLQCGDPKGNGSGGPGFAVPDENLPKAEGGSAVYRRGTVAMANSGPNTNGSQFFLVYKDSPLPPNYTVAGTITEGMPILDHVAGEGTADGSTDGAPKQPVQILTMASSAATDTTSSK